MSELIRNLKTLFKTFLYYNDEDETNIKKWLNNNITYNNGGFENKTIKKQELKIEFDALHVAPYYRRGDLKITLTPGISGQTVLIYAVEDTSGGVTIHTLTTNNKGYCVLSASFIRNYTANITVEPYNYQGVEYQGAEGSYNF